MLLFCNTVAIKTIGNGSRLVFLTKKTFFAQHVVTHKRAHLLHSGVELQ